MRTSSTLHPLPSAWVDRLFMRFSGRYGAAFSQRWAGVEDAARQEWSEGLAGFTAAEIKRGLDNLGTWPPSLPEFIQLCRPPIEPEKAFYEALKQMRIRHQGGADRWSNPVIFWAAVWMGEDLFSAQFARLKTRWIAALDQAKSDLEADITTPNIPQKVPELPAPEKKIGNRLLREICVQTFQACSAGTACPYAEELHDLPWLNGERADGIRPRMNADGTWKSASTTMASMMTSIIERAAALQEAA